MTSKRSILYTLLTLVSLISLSTTLQSCKEKAKVKALSEMLRDEEKIIKNFIAEQNLTVQEGTAQQQEFAANVWYKYDNGVYMQVIDPGTTHAEANRTRVLMRMKGRFLGSTLTSTFNNLSVGYQQATEFIYTDLYDRNGALHYRLIKERFGHTLDAIMCEGLAFPLTLVGDGARIRLIIPFLIGPDVANAAGAPMYCEEVRYEFVK